jgi:hypothetical protein
MNSEKLEKTYKPINVSKTSWTQYSLLAERMSIELGTKISIPKMLDIAVNQLQRSYAND